MMSVRVCTLLLASIVAGLCRAELFYFESVASELEASNFKVEWDCGWFGCLSEERLRLQLLNANDVVVAEAWSVENMGSYDWDLAYTVAPGTYHIFGETESKSYNTSTNDFDLVWNEQKSLQVESATLGAVNASVQWSFASVLGTSPLTIQLLRGSDGDDAIASWQTVLKDKSFTFPADIQVEPGSYRVALLLSEYDGKAYSSVIEIPDSSHRVLGVGLVSGFGALALLGLCGMIFGRRGKAFNSLISTTVSDGYRMLDVEYGYRHRSAFLNDIPCWVLFIFSIAAGGCAFPIVLGSTDLVLFVVLSSVLAGLGVIFFLVLFAAFLSIRQSELKVLHDSNPLALWTYPEETMKTFVRCHFGPGGVLRKALTKSILIRLALSPALAAVAFGVRLLRFKTRQSSTADDLTIWQWYLISWGSCLVVLLLSSFLSFAVLFRKYSIAMETNPTVVFSRVGLLFVQYYKLASDSCCSRRRFIEIKSIGTCDKHQGLRVVTFKIKTGNSSQLVTLPVPPHIDDGTVRSLLKQYRDM
eukprot:GILK01007990.1.p1 GENE.GILK01007990.1~~GILK01007990.1.p1  ORF type:complete len:529 (-),score=53.23 GILK01007990.1:106-1692(-)